MDEKVIFIINPISGRRCKANIPELIDDAFQDAEAYQIIYTKFAGEATQIVKQYIKKGCKKFIAVGGDGTVNEVASAIVDTDAVLGIVPIGSGNGLARHLKIPLNINKAINLVKAGNVIKIDYGKINDYKFFCTTGVGFDAHVGNVFSKSASRGFSNYVKATLSEFRRYVPKRYELSVNGTTIMRDAFSITFANASQFGNNAHIAPKAEVTDGKLEVSILKTFPVINGPVIGARLFLKNIDKSKYVETFSCEEIIVKRKESDVVHFDGEPKEMGEILNIKVIPEGLNVLVT